MDSYEGYVCYVNVPVVYLKPKNKVIVDEKIMTIKEVEWNGSHVCSEISMENHGDEMFRYSELWIPVIQPKFDSFGETSVWFEDEPINITRYGGIHLEYTFKNIEKSIKKSSMILYLFANEWKKIKKIKKGFDVINFTVHEYKRKNRVVNPETMFNDFRAKIL